MARRYFGTDGVRGIVGEDLTPQLVERLGRAATLWAGGGAVFIGRDTRGSGPRARARVRERRRLCGRQRGARRACCRRRRSRCSRSTSASSSPRRTTRPSTTASSSSTATGASSPTRDEEEIEALLDAPPQNAEAGRIDDLEVAVDSYLDHVLERFGSDLDGLRIGVDCANGAYSWIAPRAFEELGAEVTAIGVDPDGTNINVGCGATDLRALQQLVREDRARPRRRVRRRRRPDARGGRERRRARRRPDPRRARARPRGRHSSP